VDVHASEELIAQMPPEIIAISESGLKTSEDLVRLRQLGYRAFLMGERLMSAADPGLELTALLAGSGSAINAKDTKDTKAIKEMKTRT
jgi:indole-3-glycerol phosphate synthase